MSDPTEIPTTSEPKLWTERVGAFAKAIGVTLEEANAAFEPIVGKPSDENVATLVDPDCVSDQDFTEAFPKVPKANVKKAAKNLRAAAQPAAPTPSAAPAMAVMLPTPLDDEKFLDALRVGGVPKVSATEVSAAVRIYVAHQLGLDEIPERVLAMMEEHANSMDEPINEDFGEVRKIVMEKRYGEILEAINLKGFSVTEKHRRELLTRMARVPDVLRGFQAAAVSWRDEWTTQGANPMMIMQALTAAMGGGPSGLLQGMAQPPDTGNVTSSAEGVIDAFNKMFAGYGRAAARAMGYDAVKVKKVLTDSRVLPAVGVTTREELLKKLGVGVSADMVRLESDLGRYVLAIYQLAEGKVPSDQLPVYIFAIANLGTQINWDRLENGNGVSGRPDTRPRGRVGTPERQTY